MTMCVESLKCILLTLNCPCVRDLCMSYAQIMNNIYINYSFKALLTVFLNNYIPQHTADEVYECVKNLGIG